MSEYTSSRGDGSGRSDAPGGTYTPPVIVPRSSYQTGTTSIKGKYVYVKPGYTINFFNKPDGGEKVGKQGKQSSDPSRSNGEPVGVATGSQQNGYIQVDWVNTWTEKDKPGFGIGFNFGLPKKGKSVSENKTSWVKADSVTLADEYTDPSNPTTDDYIPDTDGGGGGTSSGIDATTLGLAAVGAALIFGKKKRKKR